MSIISHINPKENWAIQSNEDHSNGVAKLCSKFASEFGMGTFGKIAGLLHDKGKEKKAFQQHIKRESGLEPHIKVDGDYSHAYVGALIAKQLYPQIYHSYQHKSLGIIEVFIIILLLNARCLNTKSLQMSLFLMLPTRV